MLAGCDAKTINPLTRAICRIPDTNSERGIVHLIRGTLRNLPVPMADSSSLLPPQSFRVSGLQSWLSLYFSLGGNHKREKGKKKKKKKERRRSPRCARCGTRIERTTTSSSSRETADALVPGEDFS